MIEQRQVLQEKAKKVEEIQEFLEEYKVIALASLHKVRAAQLQELRKKLQDAAHLRVIKNSLMKRVIDQSKSKPNLDKLEGHLTGSTIFLFTDLNPFAENLARLLFGLLSEKINSENNCVFSVTVGESDRCRVTYRQDEEK